MNEQRRQAYLKAMGIQSWFPRFILPVAKPSAIYDVIETSSQLTQQSNDQKSIVESIPNLHSAQTPVDSLMHDLQEEYSNKHLKSGVKRLETSVSSSASISEPQALNEAEDSQPAMPFRLAVTSVTDDILVITDIPLTESPVMSVASKKLLGAIIYALGWQGASAASWQSDTLTWPLIGMPEDLNEAEASEAVQGFLVNRFGIQRRKHVLLLGQFSARHALECYQEFEMLQGVSPKESGQHWGISYSLDQMLKLPALKAEVWQHLSPLSEKTYA